MILPAKFRESLIFILLAFFTALATFKLFEAHLIQFAYNYEGFINFTGAAPEQYRILPYLFLKALAPLAGLNIATLIFSFICFALLYYVLYFRVLTSLALNARWLVLILFSLLYPVFMIWGYRPVTVFSILLVACIVAKYQQLVQTTPAYRDLGMLAVLLLLLSFSRVDTAFFTALFLCIYLRNQLPLLVKGSYVALPVIAHFLLTKIIFPEASYPERINSFTLFSNFSWDQLWICVPLVYLLLAVVMIFPATIRRLAVYIREEHMMLVLLLGAFTLVVVCVGRPREFRLYLPYIPMMLMVLNGYFHKLKTHPVNMEEEFGAGRTKDA